MKLKFAPFCSSLDAPSDGIIFAKVKIFRFWPKTMDYSPWFLTEIDVILSALITPHWRVL